MLSRPTHPILKQNDGTSCGAYTVENLLLAANFPMASVSNAEEIRHLHLECLQIHNHSFYQLFELRQRENRPTTVSLHEQLGYLAKLKNVWFSKQEISRILKNNLIF